MLAVGIIMRRASSLEIGPELGEQKGFLSVFFCFITSRFSCYLCYKGSSFSNGFI